MYQCAGRVCVSSRPGDVLSEGAFCRLRPGRTDMYRYLYFSPPDVSSSRFAIQLWRQSCPSLGPLGRRPSLASRLLRHVLRIRRRILQW